MPVPLYPMYLETPYSFKYTNLTPAITNCTGGVVWIHKVLGECVLTNRQYASVICGLVSLLIWMTVGFPQIYKNCRNPAGLEGLSLLFVIQWLLGDSTNLIGCILTEQLPVQTYTAVYYVSADLVLLSQIIYFKTKKHLSEKGARSSAEQFTW
ncbi:lysosomal amino acid transporter 1 homolog [Liolophura sinensis]|uniref:lysosomal amino acid transporter 1 homolog n=1 Tax=Liolophura sinensis TaxID=3198878 RepID=UPI0031584255